jgi:septal ring factor EnvC (AmiA/AmiB activator)
MCRIEEENESLLIQVKKMSTPQIGQGMKGKAPAGKYNGSSSAAGDSATDLKLQLEINEQESTILRRKIEDLEKTNTKLSKELHMCQDKIEALEKAAKLNVVKSPVSLYFAAQTLDLSFNYLLLFPEC